MSLQIRNLRTLLLTPPLSLSSHAGAVMGIDPGFAHGWSAISRNSERCRLGRLIRDYGVAVVAVGNGVASRETEVLLSELASNGEIQMVIVVYIVPLYSVTFQDTVTKRRRLNSAEIAGISEANAFHFVSVSEVGVSIWSVTPSAEIDLPNLTPNLRGAVAIARRLIVRLSTYRDPLCIVFCVWPLGPSWRIYEGLDLNSAPFHLIKSIAGLGPSRASAIIQYRDAHGCFTSREDLKKVNGIGSRIFQQCAGFLRIRSAGANRDTLDQNITLLHEDVDMDASPRKRRRASNSKRLNDSRIHLQNSDGVNPLDSTWIHPEQYDAAEKLIRASGVSLSTLNENESRKRIQALCQSVPTIVLLTELGVDEPTLKLIVDGLTSPVGFVDIRSHMEAPLFRNRVLGLDEIHPGDRLKGRITNITSFGVFVDIGIGREGMIHRKSLQHQLEQLLIGQTVDVKIISIDRDREKPRISLQLNNGP
ncbi:S1 RNA-binding domain-containing protein 1-like [Condylostylus longicornis]|uniref:S1 RNA-binding domain-containing protein 1-like n=1 Tax=Condylostylus longicornis TaxID=2530218 RepID=UPI00244E01E3|nr:S1 RNA-binding domain-containing protein 1-like [Condylostylus longicornis]